MDGIKIRRILFWALVILSCIVLLFWVCLGAAQAANASVSRYYSKAVSRDDYSSILKDFKISGLSIDKISSIDIIASNKGEAQLTVDTIQNIDLNTIKGLYREITENYQNVKILEVDGVKAKDHKLIWRIASNEVRLNVYKWLHDHYKITIRLPLDRFDFAGFGGISVDGFEISKAWGTKIEYSEIQ